jgi:hypothetical protein
VLRVRSTVNASAAKATTLEEPKLTFGGALTFVQDIMSFLQGLGIPTPLNVAMTNKLQFKAGLKIPMDKELNKLLPPDSVEFDDTDVTVSLTIDSPLSEAEFELTAVILVPTPYKPLKGVGMFKFAIKISTETGNTFTLTLGAGIAIGFNIDTFDCKAYFIQYWFLVIGDSTIGGGIGFLLKGSINLIIISVDVSVEAKFALLRVSCPGGSSLWGVAQITFAIEVTIAFIIDISFEVQGELDDNFDNGPCPLPDVL